MRQLTVFNHISLDGYFVDRKGEMSWAHRSDPEWDQFVAGNASHAAGVMLFGRVTWEMMASWWPSPMAMKSDPVVAAAMNSAEKVVFSRKLKKAAWNNTTLFKRGLVSEVRKLKEKKDVVVMGSGTIVSQLAQEGLIDLLQLVVNPLVLGKGRTLFEGVKRPLAWKLKSARSFKNGNVVLSYTP
jgi:dihydrofolate reductase